MDINMQPVDGFETTKRIHHYSPASKIIGVSMYSLPAYAKKIITEWRYGICNQKFIKRRND
ncbi:MAG: hypothetical protein WDO19_13705 [Bacteroidota bacterium]